MGGDPSPDPRKVFVVHGRNAAARDALFDFLRSIGLRPIEWSQAVQMTGEGSPYIGQVLHAAFSAAQAIVVLMTPDEITYLRMEYANGVDDPDTQPAAQARPNVLFEAGMALGKSPERTILVELGVVRPFSDVAGRHALRLDGGPSGRKDLAARLEAAGCSVDLSGTDWITKGDLTPPPPPGGGLPLGKKGTTSPSGGIRIDAQHLDRGRGDGRLQLTNYSSIPLHDVSFEIPPEAGSAFWVDTWTTDRQVAGREVGDLHHESHHGPRRRSLRDPDHGPHARRGEDHHRSVREPAGLVV